MAVGAAFSGIGSGGSAYVQSVTIESPKFSVDDIYNSAVFSKGVDSLEKNRKVRKEQVENGVENSILYWGDDLTPLYAQASLSIAMHNIWSSGEKEEIKEKYRNLGLESLITGESDIFPISIKDNPLLFLLGLVDTIEPIKTFNCLEPQYVLENILIDFDKIKLLLVIKKLQS